MLRAKEERKEKKKRKQTNWRRDGREKAGYAVGSQLFIFISMHGKSWQPSCAATAITPPAYLQPPPLFFHRPPLATSRIFAGHKYKKLAGTNRSATIYCIWVLGFVNRGNVPLSCNRRPSPSLSCPRFRALPRGRALLISPEQTPWITPAPASSAPPQISEADVACRPRSETSRYREFSPLVSIPRFSEGGGCFSFVRKRLNCIYLEMDGYSLLCEKKINFLVT